MEPFFPATPIRTFFGGDLLYTSWLEKIEKKHDELFHAGMLSSRPTQGCV